MKKKIVLLLGLVLLLGPGSAFAEETELSSSTTEMSTTQEEISETTDATTTTSETLHSTESSEEETSFSEVRESPEQPVETETISQYISLKHSHSALFSDINPEIILENNYSLGETFLAKEKAKTVDNIVYLKLYNSSNDFIGYIKENDVVLVHNPGGIAQTFNKYVTITTATGTLYGNFEGQVKGTTASYVNQTFLAKEKFSHFDGENYYSLYNKNNKWLGYLKEKDLAIAKGRQGIYQSFGKYVTITKNNYSIWHNFAWKKKYNSKQFYNRTFLARGEYRHFNGETYYSIYDTKGTWYGYINKTGTSPSATAQGPYLSFGKYVTVKNTNQNAWNNFSWNQRQPLKNIAGQTFIAKRLYNHANGSVYYSLYDRNNKWQGYVNKKFVNVAAGKQGVYQASGKYGTITDSSYKMWQNFSWKRKSTTKSMSRKTYQIKGLYRHFNGETYHSLYNNKGTWLGYVNAKAVSVAAGPQGIYQGYGKDVTISKKNWKIWSNFSWKFRDNTSNHYQKRYKARGKYNHFNGSTYVSLYDNKGKWYGYLNEKATSQDADKLKKVQQLLNRKYNRSNYGIYVMSLTDGSTASINGNTRFTAASTGKLPAMYYTQKMINEKKLNGNKPYRYTDAINRMPLSYQRDGAGILQGRPYGGYYSLNTILQWTAKYSDNQGANFLGYYGANKYDATMKKEISRVIGRSWSSPFSITAKENALLIAAMYNQGGQVMNYMQNTIFDNQRIPKYLPVKVAHKIGDVGVYRHDVAVVYAKKPYVLAVMTKNGISYEQISILSKEIYNIMK